VCQRDTDTVVDVAPFPFLSVVLGVAAAAVGSLALLGYRRGGTPGARTFVLLSIATTIYVAIYAVSIAVPYGELRAALGAAQWFGVAFVPVAWLLFALDYSGRQQYLTRPFVLALCIVPAVSIAGAVATAVPAPPNSLVARLAESFHASTTATDWMGHTFVGHELGPVYVLHVAFAYLCLLAGVVVLLEFVVRYDRLYRQQALSIVVGAVFPALGNAVALAGHEPVPGMDVLPLVVPVSVALFANAVFRYDFLDITPAPRRRGESTVVAEMRDAVVVVDADDRVVDVNAAACERFDLARGDVLGGGLAAVVDVAVPPDVDRFEVEHAGDVYEVTVSPVRDRHDRVIGRTLVFRDITSYHDAKQRLSVLNRVLRHNLRTEVNVISGYASMVERELDGPRGEQAAEIATAADRLADFGRKAREVERIMSRDGPPEPCDLRALVDETVADVRRNHEALVVDASAPANVVVTLDPVVFGAVVGDLLNALAHHGAGDRLSLSVAVADDAVVVDAATPGAGIPESEYGVVLDGQETPLEHASDLSLWLVKWGVRHLNGDLAFRNGGCVRVTLPDCVTATRADGFRGEVVESVAPDGGGEEADSESGGGEEADSESDGGEEADSESDGAEKADSGSGDSETEPGSDG